jgi:hypothetical protein
LPATAGDTSRTNSSSSQSGGAGEVESTLGEYIDACTADAKELTVLQKVWPE